MNGSLTRSMTGVLGVGVLLLGLSGPALAQGPPSRSLEDIEATLGIILDRLDDIETKIDSQVTDLRGVKQNWDKKLDSTNGDTTAGREGCDSDRFTCLFGDTVVRDNETGLVWDRDPDIGDRNWTSAISHCALREVGNRKGWSLPMREQLSSLVDTSNSRPALPTDHPFPDGIRALYWSASTDVLNPHNAWLVDIAEGGVLSIFKNGTLRAWCVRGDQSFDGNTHTTLH